MTNKNETANYSNRVHTLGIIFSLILIASMLIVPLGAQLIFKQEVDWGLVLKTIGSILLVFGPVAVIEFFSYVPIIGAGGQYLSFITGNVMTMKVPAAATGKKIAGVENGTEEGDAISMISIAVSSIVTTLIVFLGMILAAQLLPILESEVLSPAFKNVVPAIMGALGIPLIVRGIKTAVIPAALSVILTVVMGYGAFMAKQGNMMILFLVVSLGWAYFLYRRKMAKEQVSE